MKRTWCILILVTGLSRKASSQVSELAIGRAYYTEGEFKKAVEHFQLAIKTNPNDAESYYWAGMSYQVLADIAAPFDGKYNSKARVHLTKGNGTRSRPPGLSPGTLRVSLGFRRLLADCFAAGCEYCGDDSGIRPGLQLDAPTIRIRVPGELLSECSTG